MRKGLCAATLGLLAVCRGVPAPTDLRLETEAILESPGDLMVRARASWEDLHGFLTASGTASMDASGGIDGIPERIVAGLAGPWFAAGPLEARGLLRLAASPLAFSAGSAAWRERTGMESDPTLSPSRFGIAAFPLPDTFCLYFVQAGDGAEAGPREAGIFLSLPAGNAAMAEAVLSVSDPDVPPAAKGWYVSRSRWAGGLLGRAAFRAVILPPSGTVSLSGGASFGGFNAPGAFAQTAAAFQGEAGSVAAFLALCGRDYMARDGRGPADLMAASAEAAIGGSGDTGISCACSFRIAQPGPVPAPYLAAHHGLSLELRRAFPLDSLCALVLRGRAEKSLAWDTEGDPSGAASTEWGFGAQAGTWRAEAALSVGDKGNGKAGMEASFDAGRDPARLSASGACSIGFPEGTLSAEARLAIRSVSWQLSIRAGLDASQAGFSVGWRTRTVIPR